MASQNCLNFDEFPSQISLNFDQFQSLIKQNQIDSGANSDESQSTLTITQKLHSCDQFPSTINPNFQPIQSTINPNCDQFPSTINPNFQQFPALPEIRQYIRSGIHLGDGSFGQVSLGFDLHRNRAIAIKSATNPNSIHHRESLLNELKILKTLNSPKIVNLLGSSGNPPDSIFLEYMDGGSVADAILRQGPLPLPAVRQITAAVVEGLDYLHGRGVVHCDIKSHNILLSLSTASVKIADFGSAKFTATETTAETAESPASFRGSPLYMAPEVLHGVEQSFASDIWSLGCTVFHMLQGRPPFATIAAAAAAGDTSDIDALFTLVASKDAADFVKKCLVRDPRSRHTAAQLLQHPFVRQSDGCCRNMSDLFGVVRRSDSFLRQFSPRSVLDIQGSSVDSEADHASSSNRNLDDSGNPRIKEAERSGNWITVRQSDGWTGDRNRPFTLDQPGHDHQILKHLDVRPLASIFGR